MRKISGDANGPVVVVLSTASSHPKPHQREMELLREERGERLMTTGGKGMWRKTAPSMAEVVRDYLIERQGHLA